MALIFKAEYLNLQGILSNRYGQYISSSESLTLTAPPDTWMKFEISWTNLEWTGNLTVNGKSGTYTVLAPIDVALASSEDLGCPTPTLQVPAPTNIPTETPPVSIPDVTVKPSGTGCFCEPKDCLGIPINQGTEVPASSILQPDPENRGTLYMYIISGKAEVGGVLWVYIDENGNPASQACVQNQLNFFTYDQLQTIK